MTQVLAPGFEFSTLRAQLDGLGWHELRLSGTLPPLIAGEPETAAFLKGQDRIDYTFNPALSLRLVTGPLPTTLPMLSPAQIATLIAARSPEDVLLGAAAAAATGLHSQRSAILMRAGLLPPPLARHALNSADQLSPLSAEALYFLTLPADMRRQVLRIALKADSPDASDLITLALAADAESAVTAMIGAARSGLHRLLPALPTARGQGDALLVAIRKLAAATLSGKKPGSGTDPRSRLWRAILGDETDAEMAFRLAPLIDPAPDADPPVFIAGIRFCKVASISHWIGDADRPDAARRDTPDEFLIAELPVLNCQPGIVLAAMTDLLRSTGRVLRLPTDVELHCALCGPDGRPHPWGMDHRPMAGWTSPWGVKPGDSKAEFCTVGHMIHVADNRRPTSSQPATPATGLAGLRPVLVDR